MILIFPKRIPANQASVSQEELAGLAHEPPDVKPFSSAFTRRYGLRSSSNAQRAAAALLKRDVVDRDNGSFIVTDRFLRLWIRRVYGQARHDG